MPDRASWYEQSPVTHVGDQERKTIHFENFNEASIYCRAEKSKGGTAIYVNKGITSREINVSDLAFEGGIELCGEM